MGRSSRALTTAALAVALVSCTPAPRTAVVLNDVHSRLNPTEVAEYHEPTTAREIAALRTMFASQARVAVPTAARVAPPAAAR